MNSRTKLMNVPTKSAAVDLPLRATQQSNPVYIFLSRSGVTANRCYSNCRHLPDRKTGAGRQAGRQAQAMDLPSKVTPAALTLLDQNSTPNSVEGELCTVIKTSSLNEITLPALLLLLHLPTSGMDNIQLKSMYHQQSRSSFT